MVLGIARLLSYPVIDHIAAGRLVRFLDDFALSPVPVRSEEPAKAKQYLYVVCPGIRDLTQYGGAGILVFDVFIANADDPSGELFSARKSPFLTPYNIGLATAAENSSPLGSSALAMPTPNPFLLRAVCVNNIFLASRYLSKLPW